MRVTVDGHEFGWGQEVQELPQGDPFELEVNATRALVHAAHDLGGIVYRRTGPSNKRPYLIEDGKRRPLLTNGVEALNIVDSGRRG
jgi:hypothetical protein